MISVFPIDRRRFLGLAAGAASLLASGPLRAQDNPPASVNDLGLPDETGPAGPLFGEERHGLSAFGDLKYPPDFAHFAYVRPDAPKGGTLSQVGPSILYNQNFNTFNSLNTYVLRGDGAQGMQNTFATLMVTAQDEPDSIYGLVAQSVAVSEDGLVYRFRLRPEATFHDGTPITANDVAVSITLLEEKGHPLVAQQLRWVEGAAVEEEGAITVRFRPGRPRDLPLLVAGLPIFSAAYYAERDFTASTLEAPLGSGPYRVGRFEVGRFIEYERVADWWGAELPVCRGQWNFDRIRYEYFRDRDVAFEAFKSGAYLFREEFTSRQWARGYDFPAVRDKRIVRDEIPDGSPSGAQGWFFNVRRQKFQDRRVRQALELAFDFEWINANLMFDSYQRTASFFENSPLKAEGEPSPEELALLEPHRARLPAEVFGRAVEPPSSDGSGRDRRHLLRAQELLGEAGWSIRNEVDESVEFGFMDRLMMTIGLKEQPTRRVLRNANGQTLTIEFLDFEPGLEPHTMAFIQNLNRLGIEASIRRVDPAQYQARLNEFDFDITSRRYNMSMTPGESLQLVFGSESANTKGSRNLSGIADPAIDALIDIAINAETRETLVTACRALDRVIRAGHYWVPAWYKGSHWLAFWDAYDRPDTKPQYGRGVMETWWWNPDKASRTGVTG